MLADSLLDHTKKAPMIYLSCRLHRPEPIDISELITFWKRLAHDIVDFDESTWKIWDITQVFREDDVQSRVYTMNKEWEELKQPVKMVARAAPCYLRAEQQDH